CLQGYITPYSF
nr:immunoglobulin light chain junction region [Macaca mulatta]MOV77638.1 immunoglobulin light chain junction region [Macaca mulatta]MOV77846.1 immunoglobulin light chain junction region [Macaca mulatta]MOV78172.1 immunoglobulin light chain junction region [Macaca mulatta]MOV78191.1 immunoglobulin light chain junction region [Macaca mulatta]